MYIERRVEVERRLSLLLFYDHVGGCPGPQRRLVERRAMTRMMMSWDSTNGRIVPDSSVRHIDRLASCLVGHASSWSLSERGILAEWKEPGEEEGEEETHACV